ncbi:glycosyltransferase [Pseudidiomarina mangrovi]|uniref:glycosyltransferase n=1 Tax=Pseudidiomarina mangrovi TaxID=2487133 RepID=UPI000FCAAB16|nr:glycosyltransferase [Pseudidiomarina mangrovi]
MLEKKCDLAIINRSFWPESEILGEAKFQMAEQVIANNGKACVIAQAKTDIAAEAAKQNRGHGVKFYVAKSRSNSASSLVRRIFDALLFSPFVFWSLCRARPKHVYVSTNPPVVVPFLVFIYCALFRAKYTYHLQDIHPEITNLVIPMNKWVFKLLRGLDNITLRHATHLVTLSDDMAQYIRKVSRTKAPVHLVANPSFEMPEEIRNTPKTKDFVFCGNAGRVQQIPVLLDAIESYINGGGTLNFSFAGGGVYGPKIEELAGKHSQVTYHGYVKPSSANKLVAEHRWAILPIDDEVTKYAFPSKSSSYLASGCSILAICGKDTAVARWVYEHRAGEAVKADVFSVVQMFKEIQQGFHDTNSVEKNHILTPLQFASEMNAIIVL